MSVRSIWYNVSLKATVPLLIFCLDILSIDVNGVLKSPPLLYYFELFSFCLLLVALCIGVFTCWVHKYLQLWYFLVGLCPLWLCSALVCLLLVFVLKFILSYINIATLAFFHIHLHDKCLSTLHFQSACFLHLKWVSCRRHIDESCFCIHSIILGLFF